MTKTTTTPCSGCGLEVEATEEGKCPTCGSGLTPAPKEPHESKPHKAAKK